MATSLHFDLKITSVWKPGGKRLRTSPASHHFSSSYTVQQLTHWRNCSRSVQEELSSHQLRSLGSHHHLQQESCVFGAVINVQASTALSETYLSGWNVRCIFTTGGKGKWYERWGERSFTGQECSFMQSCISCLLKRKKFTRRHHV